MNSKRRLVQPHTAVQDVAAAIGGFASEVYEIRDASRKAAEEHGDQPGEDTSAE